MNFDENTKQWRVGDKVIHDADAKEERMLMVVIGYRKDGLVKTRYLKPSLLTPPNRGTFTNELKYLHDPARFDLKK